MADRSEWRPVSAVNDFAWLNHKRQAVVQRPGRRGDWVVAEPVLPIQGDNGKLFIPNRTFSELDDAFDYVEQNYPLIDQP